MHTHTWYKVITQKYSTGTNDGREISLFKQEYHDLLINVLKVARLKKQAINIANY